MPMAWRNIVAATALLAFSAWYAWLANGLPERSLPNTPGPSFFPLVVITLVAVLSAALLVKGIADSARPGAVSPLAPLAVGSFFVYLALLPVAGFVIASVAFFAALMFLYGSRRPLHIAAASLVAPAVLFVLFRYGFQIVLPRGPLGF